MFMLHLDPASAALDAVAADPPPERPSAARALVDRQVAVLSELVDIGMEIARAAGRRATATLEGEEAAPAHPDPTLAYARAAKAVRMCVALQARLLKDLPAIETGERLALSELSSARKRHIVERVSRAAEDDPVNEYDIENLADAAWEHLRDADEYSALMTVPLQEAVTRICKELGLPPQDWVGEGSPFAPPSGSACADPPSPEVSRPTPAAPRADRSGDGAPVTPAPAVLSSV
jgi:hypothetical protein